MDLKQLERIFNDKCHLTSKQSIVVGVSGGSDSLCLLDLVFKNGLPVIVGHLNHGLREEASGEAEMVRHFCEERSIPCVIKQVNVHAIAKTSRQSIEEAGRKARYQFLFELAIEKKAQAVAVAHNLDDQVETILMHLLRGSGMTGLKGMDYCQSPNEWSDLIPLVRPLLDFTKVEVMDYCAINTLVYANDITNQDQTYYRNHLRMDLVPYLETYNPQVKARLASMAEVLRQEDDYLRQESQSAIKLSVTARGNGFFCFSREKLRKLHPAILRRVLYVLMKQLQPSTPNISFETIDKAANFLETPSKSKKLALVAGLEISNYLKDSILLAETNNPLDELWPQILSSQNLHPPQVRVLKLNGNWRLEVYKNPDIEKENPWYASLDGKKITSLSLDTFKPGDRFSPLGMAGKSMKLGDYWTNEGLPLRVREHWPLLRSGTEIVWIPGFTISENYKVSNSTSSKISIRIFRE